MYNTAVINLRTHVPVSVMKIEDLRNQSIHNIRVIMNSNRNEIIIREIKIHKDKAITNCFIKSITPPKSDWEVLEAKYQALSERYDNVTLLLTDNKFVKVLVVSELGSSSTILGQIRR